MSEFIQITACIPVSAQAYYIDRRWLGWVGIGRQFMQDTIIICATLSLHLCSCQTPLAVVVLHSKNTRTSLDQHIFRDFWFVVVLSKAVDPFSAHSLIHTSIFNSFVFCPQTSVPLCRRERRGSCITSITPPGQTLVSQNPLLPSSISCLRCASRTLSAQTVDRQLFTVAQVSADPEPSPW